MTMTPSSTQPERRRLVQKPNVNVSEAGRTAIASRPEEVRERRWISVRVGAISVEEAAAVGAQVFDKLQCGDRSLRDRLELAF